MAAIQNNTNEVTEVTFNSSPDENEKLIISVQKSQTSTNGESSGVQSAASSSDKDTAILEIERNSAGVMPFADEPTTLRQ